MLNGMFILCNKEWYGNVQCTTIYNTAEIVTVSCPVRFDVQTRSSMSSRLCQRFEISIFVWISKLFALVMISETYQDYTCVSLPVFTSVSSPPVMFLSLIFVLYNLNYSSMICVFNESTRFVCKLFKDRPWTRFHMHSMKRRRSYCFMFLFEHQHRLVSVTFFTVPTCPFSLRIGVARKTQWPQPLP